MSSDKKNRFKFSEIEREKIVQKAIDTLWSSEGKDILKYLVEDRNFSEKTIKEFNVGYCPRRVQHYLRNRIITPIYDEYNSLIFLSTRVPRTKNSYTFLHESIDDKGLYLYGIHKALPNIIYKQKAIIVEGEFDVLYLHSRGINTAVAACGSALSTYQVILLLRYCSEIYYVTDGDKAGKEAQTRFMKIYEDYCMKSSVGDPPLLVPAIMPDKLDPDDFIEEYGVKSFIEYLYNKKSDQYLI